MKPPERSLRSKRRETLEILLFGCSLFAHTVVLGLAAGYYAGGRMADGTDFTDLALITGVTIALGSALIAIDYLGYRFLPTLTGKARMLVAGIYIVAALLVASVTFPIAALSAAGPVAEVAQAQLQVEQAQDAAAAGIKEHDAVVAMIPAFIAGVDMSNGMVAREKQTGAISGTVGGTGRTADALSNVASVLGSGVQSLVQARSQGAPLVRRIGEIGARLRRISENDRLRPIEKARENRASMIELSETLAALRALAPLGTMAVVTDTLRTDWAAAGQNEQATGKMSAAFVPMADRFDEALAPVREASFREPFVSEELRGFELLAAHGEVVWPLLGLVLALEILPALGVIVLLATAGRSKDLDSSDFDDWPPSPFQKQSNGRLADDEIPV